MTDFDGQRFRIIHDPASGTARYEATAAYEAWVKAQLAKAAADEQTIDRWLLGGMIGRLVRRNGGALEVDTSDPQHVGELVIFVEDGA